MVYLRNRCQLMQVDGKQSGYLLVTRGNPQGSILEPDLFNIYVSDMSEHTSGTFLQYKKDTSL